MKMSSFQSFVGIIFGLQGLSVSCKLFFLCSAFITVPVYSNVSWQNFIRHHSDMLAVNIDNTMLPLFMYRYCDCHRRYLYETYFFDLLLTNLLLDLAEDDFLIHSFK